MTNLTQLDLHRNKLTKLPESIKLLEKLTELGLSCNKLTKLPESITLLEKLIHLDLSDNPSLMMKDIPQSLIDQANKEKLTIVGWGEIVVRDMTNAAGLDLTTEELPRFEWALRDNGAHERELNLGGLKLADTRLEYLIPLIQECGIARLDLRNNKLTKVPESMEKLEKLIWLNLRGNPLLTMEGIPQPLIERANRNQLTIVGLEEIK